MVNYTSLIENEFRNKSFKTLFGEPQICFKLESGRSLEITHEEDGLREDEQFYSVMIHCTEEEFENDIFGPTCGVVATCTSPTIAGIAECMAAVLSAYKEKPSEEYKTKVASQ